MKISTKGRYALRLMTDLAMHSEDGYVPIKVIAERQNISDKYLEQIISTLNKAGYVRSVRGAQGGYLLRKSPREYTVGDILRLTEGSLSPVSCLEDGEATCSKEPYCVSYIVYKKIDDAIEKVVDGITLEDMVGWAQERSADNYVI